MGTKIIDCDRYLYFSDEAILIPIEYSKGGY